MAVIIPFSPADATIDRLAELVTPDMQRVNAEILTRTGSEVTMIPEVANHLINSGGKRLRPMLTLAMAVLTGYMTGSQPTFAGPLRSLPVTIPGQPTVDVANDLVNGKKAELLRKIGCIAVATF